MKGLANFLKIVLLDSLHLLVPVSSTAAFAAFSVLDPCRVSAVGMPLSAARLFEFMDGEDILLT